VTAQKMINVSPKDALVLGGSKLGESFTLSDGTAKYDASGKLIAENLKNYSPKSPGAPKGTTSSGGLKYTPKDAQEDSKALEATRGGDGFVDPTIYQKLYKAWVDNGGLLKDFLRTYPPKNYVNPANTWLPPFLMPATKKNTSSTRPR